MDLKRGGEKVIQTDLLIVGSGGAALSAALSAKECGIVPLVVSEGMPTRSQTCMAQGGINAALGHIEPDSVQMHIDDTLRAAGGIAEERMVRLMCEAAPETIAWLERLGMPFSRTETRKIAQRRLGGASSKRACYAQDYSGLKLLHTLFDASLREEVAFWNEHLLLEFVVEEGRIKGALFLEMRTGEMKSVFASTVIVATGGYAALYHGRTTNQNSATGDGIAAALRAGAKLSNMEFVQFHPTGLRRSGILISESARGAGGRLLNQNGERFVDELAPRDQVSRAIWRQMHSGNEVFLDIRHLGEAYIDEQIPQERRLAITYEGIDPVHDLIPIAPVAHYSMGGIDVNEEMMSGVEGLFAVGECANAHVHGANRLGGNSLLEVTAFGRIAGRSAAAYARIHRPQPFSKAYAQRMQKRLQELLELPVEVDFYERRATLGRRAYEEAGIERDAQELKQLLRYVEEVQGTLGKMGVFDKGAIYNTNLVERLKFAHTLQIAQALLGSALLREESRGAHYRTDAPEPKEAFARESYCRLVAGEIETGWERGSS